MPFGHRPDPNAFAGAEARRVSANSRRDRLRKSAEQPWTRFLFGIALKLIVIFLAASLAFWLLSLVRGY